MSILFLISRFLDGGIDTVLVEYLNNLQRLTNHRITLAIMLCMGDDLEVYRSRLSPDVRVVWLIHEPLLTAYRRRVQHGHRNALLGAADELILNPLRRVLVQRRLNRLARQADVVIDFDSCFAPYLHPDWTVRKIAFFHFSFNKELERAPRRIHRLQTRLARYDHVVTLSDAMLHEARTLFPDQQDKFCRIYNAVNPERLQQMATEPLPSGLAPHPFLLCVERLEETQKDLTTLLHAYALLRRRLEEKTITPPHLYIIGKGRDEAMLKALTHRLGLDAYVRFLGFQSNPYPWMHQAAAVVHSAKFEGLPTVLIEALMLDSLIVATDCPTGPREILANGRAGILVPVADADAMATALETLLTDFHLQTTLRQGIQIHKKTFLPETAIRALEGLMLKWTKSC